MPSIHRTHPSFPTQPLEQFLLGSGLEEPLLFGIEICPMPQWPWSNGIILKHQSRLVRILNTRRDSLQATDSVLSPAIYLQGPVLKCNVSLPLDGPVSVWLNSPVGHDPARPLGLAFAPSRDMRLPSKRSNAYITFTQPRRWCRFLVDCLAYRI